MIPNFMRMSFSIGISAVLEAQPWEVKYWFLAGKIAKMDVIPFY